MAPSNAVHDCFAEIVKLAELDKILLPCSIALLGLMGHQHCYISTNVALERRREVHAPYMTSFSSWARMVSAFSRPFQLLLPQTLVIIYLTPFASSTNAVVKIVTILKSEVSEARKISTL